MLHQHGNPVWRHLVLLNDARNVAVTINFPEFCIRRIAFFSDRDLQLNSIASGRRGNVDQRFGLIELAIVVGA